MIGRSTFPFSQAALLALVVAGCARPEPVADRNNAAEPQSCATRGGVLARRGILQQLICVTPYADAGKKCTDKADCTGRCILDRDLSRHSPGDTVVGQCQPDNALFGCYAEVRGGRMLQPICVD